METRRTLLKRGLLGTALLALGSGVTLAFRHSKLVDLPPEGLLVLGKKEYAVVDAIARRVLSPASGAPTVDDLRIAFTCDRILALTDETSQVEMRQLLELFENALTGFLFGGRVTPFTRLDPERQDAVLDEWRRSNVELRRTGYLAVRSLVVSAYYGDPRTWPSVGYPGPPAAFVDPNAPVWKGGGEPRPPGPGVWVEP